jgi:hypothetical protein
VFGGREGEKERRKQRERETDRQTDMPKPMLCILYPVTVVKLVQRQMMCESRDLH